jgi:DHA1 family tetracycline resistance protein-like MFS transporter
MVLIVSQIGSTLAWAMMALAPSVPFVLLSRALEGLSGGNIAVTQAYVADLVEPKRRGEAFSYVGAAFSAGFVFGPATGGWLAGRYGFAVPFLLAAALQFLTLVLTIFMLPESRSKPTEEERSAVGLGEIAQSLADRAVAPVLWLRLVYTLAMYGWFSAMTLVLHAQLGWNVVETSYVFAGFGVMQVVLQLAVVGRFVDRAGSRVATNLGFAFCIAAFALVPFATTFPLAIALLVLFGIGVSVENAAFPKLASDVAPENRRGTVLGVLSGLDSLAGSVMPWITTGVLGAFGVPPVAAILVALAVTALAVGLVQARRDGRVAAAAGASGG